MSEPALIQTKTTLPVAEIRAYFDAWADELDPR